MLGSMLFIILILVLNLAKLLRFLHNGAAQMKLAAPLL